jgi:putative copper export protein/methionine-rich copper-binding protein CopC
MWIDKRFLNKDYLLVAVLLSIIIAGTLELSVINYAYAHSLPVTENPAPNSIIPKGVPLPSSLTVDFSERPSPSVSTIQVLNSNNEPVSNGDFKIIGDHDREAMTTLDTKKLTDGVYTVSWRTQSLDDGHIARGSYVFGIGNVGPAAITASASSSKASIQMQSVTSNLDGLIKWPIIVSQAAIVGGIFSHLFLWENFGSKIRLGTKVRLFGYRFGYDKTSLQWLRRFAIILVGCSVAIIAASSASLFLQITELSTHNDIHGYSLIFRSIIFGPSGIGWLIRSIMSLIVIGCSTTYYYALKTKALATVSTNSNVVGYDLGTSDAEQEKNRSNMPRLMSSSSFLFIALIAGSVSIFGNSLTSHNAGVQFFPSVSVSLDWLHFMAVSIWIGGLFYISTILFAAIKSRVVAATITETNTATAEMRTKAPLDINENTVKRRSITLYYLALLLPRFSFLATISLGVIGVSGLYMAWMHLHTFNSLFNTAYGNILIIKLSAALPLVLLGAYHQLRLHRNIVVVAKIGRRERGATERIDRNIINDTTDINQRSHTNASQTFSDNSINHNNGYPNDPNLGKGKETDFASKFAKTIKIESLIAICVLLAASLLTITSPPAMNMPSMAMTSSSSSSSTQSMNMPGMSTTTTATPAKNGTFVTQQNILNVNTKIEINPFYAGFNFFKVTFTDSKGKPYAKVNAAEMTFTNHEANIGPIVANLRHSGPGVFSVTGAYISQPGNWDIALVAQRPSDFDLNYEFTADAANAPHPPSSTPQSTAGAMGNSSMKEVAPNFDWFAWLAIALAAAVALGSTFYHMRSKKELRKTIEMLEVEQSK